MIQIVLTILFIFVTIISLLVLYDAYLKFDEKEGLFSDQEVEEILRIIRLISVLITLGFLWNTYQGVQIAKQLDAYNQNLKIQLFNSWISIIPALLDLYVTYNSDNELVQSFNPET